MHGGNPRNGLAVVRLRRRARCGRCISSTYAMFPQTQNKVTRRDYCLECEWSNLFSLASRTTYAMHVSTLQRELRPIHSSLRSGGGRCRAWCELLQAGIRNSLSTVMCKAETLNSCEPEQSTAMHVPSPCSASLMAGAACTLSHVHAPSTHTIDTVSITRWTSPPRNQAA